MLWVYKNIKTYLCYLLLAPEIVNYHLLCAQMNWLMSAYGSTRYSWIDGLLTDGVFYEAGCSGVDNFPRPLFAEILLSSQLTVAEKKLIISKFFSPAVNFSVRGCQAYSLCEADTVLSFYDVLVILPVISPGYEGYLGYEGVSGLYIWGTRVYPGYEGISGVRGYIWGTRVYPGCVIVAGLMAS